jgi:signal transduction histidine kinase
VRFGLTPLKALQNAIGAVREGKTHTITGAYPPDLSPLANELNLLLEANRAILERARTQAGNLAHALKTPLSVIVNEAEREQSLLAHTVLEQAQAMNTQITASLNRARMAAIAGEDGALAVPLGTRSHVNEALAHLINMFAKVYRERNLDFEMHVPDEVYVRVEKQDLDDILANLIDNACKWAKTRVVVTVQRKSDLETSHWDITIDDDGEGLSSDQCQTALKRGQRLDTRQNGSGLGLSIVQDLVSLYAGALTLEQSPQGGLRACVVLASSE